MEGAPSTAETYADSTPHSQEMVVRDPLSEPLSDSAGAPIAGVNQQVQKPLGYTMHWRLPRTAMTYRENNTTAVYLAMNRAFRNTSAENSSLPVVARHESPARDYIEFLAALLSVPADREVRIYCDSSVAVNSLVIQIPGTGHISWRPPDNGFVRVQTAESAKFEVDDLMEEILQTIERRYRCHGCKTWLSYNPEGDSES